MENVFVVSTLEGYSFAIEKGKKVAVFETGKSMNGTDIAKELGVSRMAVSQSLKRSLKKIYYLLKKSNRHYDPFEIAVTMSQILRVSLDCENEVNKFFNLFPMEIKEEIRNYAEYYQRAKYI
jgi:predicted transcriptional regulator